MNVRFARRLIRHIQRYGTSGYVDRSAARRLDRHQF
jgi:hypothetical protein